MKTKNRVNAYILRGSTTALLALLLAGQDRTGEALALLRGISSNDALISQIRDVQTRILTDAKRYTEAYQIAAAAASAGSGGVKLPKSDW